MRKGKFTLDRFSIKLSPLCSFSKFMNMAQIPTMSKVYLHLHSSIIKAPTPFFKVRSFSPYPTFVVLQREKFLSLKLPIAHPPMVDGGSVFFN